ncbi:MAG: ABC transporter permease subunit [Spirochaetales bacterium]|nr:ABC transporter permease subunit [Spirochaetales bacterium]
MKSVLRVFISISGFLLILLLFTVLPFLLSPTETGIRFSPDIALIQLIDFFHQVQSNGFNEFVYGSMPSRLSEIIPDCFLNSFILSFTGSLTGLFFGLGSGLFISRFNIRWGEPVAAFFSFIPDFIFALLIQLIVVRIIMLFPGFPIRAVSQGDTVLFLPMVTIVLSTGSYLTASVINKIKFELTQEYILYAKAQGYSVNKLYYRHLFPVILTHIKTDLKKYISLILANLFILERLFNIRGLSKILFTFAYKVEATYLSSAMITTTDITPHLNVAITGLTSIIILFYLLYFLFLGLLNMVIRRFV